MGSGGGRAILGSEHTSYCHWFYLQADVSAVIAVTDHRDLLPTVCTPPSPQPPCLLRYSRIQERSQDSNFKFRKTSSWLM